MPMVAATRRVVDDGAGRAEQDHGDHVLPADRGLQPFGDHLEDAGVLERAAADSRMPTKNTIELMSIRVRREPASGSLSVLFLVPVNDLADRPENAEAEQDAHEGRQVSDCLEGGMGMQAGVEHGVAFKQVDMALLRS